VVIYFLLSWAAVTGIWVLAQSQCPGDDERFGIFTSGGRAVESPGGGDCASYILHFLGWGRDWLNRVEDNMPEAVV
jgi:hypothetical protein